MNAAKELIENQKLRIEDLDQHSIVACPVEDLRKLVYALELALDDIELVAGHSKRFQRCLADINSICAKGNENE